MNKEEMKAKIIGAIGTILIGLGIIEIYIPGYFSDIHPILLGRPLAYGFIVVGVVLNLIDIKMYIDIVRKRKSQQ